MSNEEVLEKMKVKLDELINLTENKYNNNESKFTKDEFGKYYELFNLVSDLSKKVNTPIMDEVNFIYQNSLSIFQDNKIKEFLDNCNKVRKLLDDPDFFKEKEKLLAEEIVLPDDYVLSQNDTNLPENSIVRKKTISNGSFATIVMYPVDNNMMVPFGNESIIINNYSKILQANQKLIEVKSGVTGKNRRYMYSLVRTGEYLKQTNYEINLQIDVEGNLLNLNCLFNNFMPSLRDNKLYEGQISSTPKEGSIEDLMKAASSSEGFVGSLMAMQSQNVDTKKINEEYLDEKYDEIYPDDALSEARRFIKFIIENN